MEDGKGGDPTDPTAPTDPTKPAADEALTNRAVQDLRKSIAAVLRNRRADGLQRDLKALAKTLEPLNA